MSIDFGTARELPLYISRRVSQEVCCHRAGGPPPPAGLSDKLNERARRQPRSRSQDGGIAASRWETRGSTCGTRKSPSQRISDRMSGRAANLGQVVRDCLSRITSSSVYRTGCQGKQRISDKLSGIGCLESHQAAYIGLAVRVWA